MKRTKEEYMALLEETANFYNLNNRGLGEQGGCVYHNHDNQKCAVGRCLINSTKFQSKIDEEIVNNSNLITGVKHLTLSGLLSDNDFKKSYRGFDVKFWEILQSFHDNSWNWGENGISDEGLDRKEVILSFINENKFA